MSVLLFCVDLMYTNHNMDNQLEKKILRTLAYFDVFEYPLTAEELFRWLWHEGGVEDVGYKEFLVGLKDLEHKDGFFFLPGRNDLVENRQKAVKQVEEKMKIAIKGIKRISWVPFVRAIFVCNTVAGAVANKESDIDLFIIVKKGRIWLSRALVTLVLSFLRMRRTKRRIKNKICLSFYVTDDNLNLSPITIPKSDIYLVYWLDQLVPVFDPDDLHYSLFRANQWAKKYLPNSFTRYEPLSRWKVRCGRIGRRAKKAFEKIWNGSYGDVIEKQARGMQHARMKLNYCSVQDEPDNRVVVNDKMLKFHENDRREEYKKNWLDRCNKLGI